MLSSLRKSPFYQPALGILRSVYGPNASFREHQFEAIDAVMHNDRTLIVEKTGWGKSLIYFVCCKLLRQMDALASNTPTPANYTIVISPLLALISNQMEAAAKFGLRAASLSSALNADERKQVTSALNAGAIDILFTTPETLTSMINKKFNFRVNFLVIDEAHCISDWGHDFRPDYSALARSLNYIGDNGHILATTATATERVINDIKAQFGNKLYVQRGDLMRDSLYQDVISFDGDATKLAWLLDNLPTLLKGGSGIIYCHTVYQTKLIAKFLQSHNIKAFAYNADLSNEEASRLENDFMRNQIQILVATSKLGMGYDKPDIAFVIHFQCPQNIISYYQQIGRAGRMLEGNQSGRKTYVLMMASPSDEEVVDFFIDSAFPEKEEVDQVYAVLKNQQASTIKQIEGIVNLSRGKITKVLKYLVNHNTAYKSGSNYYATTNPLVYDQEHINQLTQLRRREHQAVIELLNTNQCLTQHTLSHLDCHLEHPCGHCANCKPQFRMPHHVSPASVNQARDFFAHPERCAFVIKSRTFTPDGKYTENEQTADVWCLCEYKSYGLGSAIAQQKYSEQGFSPKIEDVVCGFIQDKMGDFRYITFVPSLSRPHVATLAQNVANKCNLTLVPAFLKKNGQDQKTMLNSSWQYHNVQQRYALTPEFAGLNIKPDRIILLDDVYDSGWTLTYCGYLLKTHGCQCVQPLALARSTSKN